MPEHPNMTDPEEIKNRRQECHRRSGHTVEEVLVRTGISAPDIYDYLNCIRPLEASSVKSLAFVYRVTPEFLAEGNTRISAREELVEQPFFTQYGATSFTPFQRLDRVWKWRCERYSGMVPLGPNREPNTDLLFPECATCRLASFLMAVEDDSQQNSMPRPKREITTLIPMTKILSNEWDVDLFWIWFGDRHQAAKLLADNSNLPLEDCIHLLNTFS